MAFQHQANSKCPDRYANKLCSQNCPLSNLKSFLKSFRTINFKNLSLPINPSNVCTYTRLYIYMYVVCTYMSVTHFEPQQTTNCYLSQIDGIYLDCTLQSRLNLC